MLRILTAMIINFISTPTPALCDKLVGDQMLTKDLVSVVDNWSSALVNPVVVFRGFDVDIPCVINNRNASSATQTAASNKSSVWYDKDNKTVRLTILSRQLFADRVMIVKAFSCILDR